MHKYKKFFDKNVYDNDNDWGLFVDIENEVLNKKMIIDDYVNDYVNDYYVYYISIIFLSTYIISYILLFL